MPNLVKITVLRPLGCDKTNLSIHALDSHTVSQAWDTHLFVGKDLLLADSIRINDRGNLVVEVRPECFELTNQPDAVPLCQESLEKN